MTSARLPRRSFSSWTFRSLRCCDLLRRGAGGADGEASLAPAWSASGLDGSITALGSITVLKEEEYRVNLSAEAGQIKRADKTSIEMQKNKEEQLTHRPFHLGQVRVVCLLMKCDLSAFAAFYS